MSNKAAKILLTQYRECLDNPNQNFHVGLVNENDPFTWNVTFFGPQGSPYEGGIFTATMAFSTDYPNVPPTLRFMTPKLFHPNVYEDGFVCISILHSSGEDIASGESSDIRWSPAQNPYSVLNSVLSLLHEEDFNLNSPANIEAAKLFKDHRDEFRKRAKQLVEESLEIFYGDEY